MISKTSFKRYWLIFTILFYLFVPHAIAGAHDGPVKNKVKSNSISKLLADTIRPIMDSDVHERARQEMDLTRDPALDIVPVERMIQARQQRDQMLAGPIINGNISTFSVATTVGWNERGPSNIGGRTRALLFDLGDKANGYKKVYAGGVGGGLWYTNDITATTVAWNKVNDFFDNIAISCIAQDPTNPLLIYAGTGEGWENSDAIHGLGVWKTANGGQTWSRITSNANPTTINSLLVDKNGSVYLSCISYGLIKSTNGGTTWTTVLQPSVAYAGADLQMAANGDIYASFGVGGLSGQIYISDFAKNGTNTGSINTWTNITPDATGAITTATNNWWRIKLACAPNNADIVYAAFEGYGSNNVTSIQQFSKSANKWTVKTLPVINSSSPFGNAQGWYAIALAVDPNNSNIVYTGSLDMVKSINGGSTWSAATQWYTSANGLPAAQTVHADHHTYLFPPGSSNRLLTGTDGGIHYTETANATNPVFVSKNNGYNVTQFYAVALHPTNYNYALAGAQDNGTQLFNAAGLNATTPATDGDGGTTFIDQLNGNIQITSYTNNQRWVSVDGLHFATHFFSTSGSFINPTDYDSYKKHLYSGSDAGAYYRWKNVNVTTAFDVASVTVPAFNGANVTSVTVSPITDNKVYFGLDNGTIVIVNNADVGTSNSSTLILKPYPSQTQISVSCIAVDPQSEDHILVTYSNYGIISIFETKNATAATPTWTAIEGNLPDMPVRWIMFYPGTTDHAIIATELGVWTTDLINGGSTVWAATNSGLANVRVDMLKYRYADRTLAAATHGRGLFTTTLAVLGKLFQTVKLPQTAAASYGAADFSAGATTDNATIPITYLSSNPAVATVNSSGIIHIVSAGTTIITAMQAANATYIAAHNISETITITAVLPTATTTSPATAITGTTATLAGTVSSDGGSAVTDKGMVYSTSANPTYAANTHISSGSGVGVISVNVTGLTPGTTYHYRAYATNAIGTTYGTDYTFTTTNAAVISFTGTLPALTSTYGTVSPSSSFNVSGVNLTAGILVTPPNVYEVSADNITFANTITIGGAGTVSAAAVYVRLKYNTPVGSYSGTISLSSAGAASVNGPNAAGTVNQAIATLTLSGLIQTYDGTAKSVTVSTTPSGLGGVSITYNGSTTAPTAAGSYAIVASLSNASYVASYVTGTLVINKATATIVLTNLSQTYDGTAKSITATTTPAALSGLSITYNGGTTAPTVAGTYAVVATLSNTNYTASNATGTLVIGKATATIALSGLTQTYDGTPKLVTATTSPSGLSGVTITYNSATTAPTAAGNYDISASLNNANYTAINVAATLTINKASLNIAANNQIKPFGTANPTLTVAYTGFVNSETASVLTTPPTITTTALVNSLPGTYPITASGATAANYNITYTAGTLTVLMAPPGNALAFDGSSSYTEHGTAINNVLVGKNQLTLEVWLNIASLNQNSPTLLGNYMGAIVGSQYMIRIENNKPVFWVFNGAGQQSSVSSQTSLTANRWVHVACIWDGTTMTIYYNGIAEGTTTLGGSFGSGSQALRIGASYLPQGRFGGKIDEVRIFNGVRTAAQIQTDMLGTISPATSGLLAYFNFDQGVAGAGNSAITTLNEQTANQYVGVLHSFALIGTTSNWVESYAMVTPTATAATAITNNGFTANWTAPALGTIDNGYRVEVATDAAFASPVGSSPFTTSSTALSYNVTGLNPGIKYYYRVRADKTSITGQGSLSATVQVTTNVSVISTTGALAALKSTTGHASTSTTFNISGTSMAAGILVTPPTGFEVSADNTTFAATITIGAAGNVISTPVYIRLAAADLGGSYSGNVVLSSLGATPVNVPTVLSTVIQAPATQATNLLFTNTATTTTTASWTNGNGVARAVFMAAATTGSPLPADLTAYAANSVFKSGDQIGSTGWYCVYNGTGTTVNITGLAIGTTYQAMAVEYNGSGSNLAYLTTTGAGNPASVSTKSVPTITSFSPATAGMGTTVTITGTNFTGATTVSFGGSPAIALTVISDSQIAAVVATGASGNVSVTTPYGTVTQPGFSFIAAPNITYSGNQSYVINHVISALSATNNGGAVPATVYGQVSTFAGSGQYGSVNGAGNTASFFNPRGIAMDALGNFYTADLQNQIIRKISPAGVVSTLAGSGSQGYADGTGAAASFVNPIGVATDAAGNVYVADGSNRIRKVSPAGVVTTLAGSGSQGSANGTGAAASFYYPHGIATDAYSNVYVADQQNHLIRKISPAGVVSTFAGSGLPGSANGTGTQASFKNPSGVATDAYGNVYVADAGNNLIRKISPVGLVSTFAGNGSQGSADGAAAVASFNFPVSVTTDPAGNLYIVDQNNQLMRKISPSGLVSTLAGTLQIGFANGTGTAASFNGPDGAVTDGLGNVYVTDVGNNRIRKIIVTGYSISPTLPPALNFDATTGTISGTPTSVSASAPYTVSAYNLAGSSTATFNIAVVSAPTTQATALTFKNTTTTTTTATWTNGNGAARAVFMAAATTGSPLPADLTAYLSNTIFKSGDQIGTSGWYCVYNGTGTTVNITGLTQGTGYRVMTVEYNGTGSNVAYLTTTATGNPANITTAAPAIVATVVSGPVNTVYGTASGSAVFNVSGSYLSSAITIAAPSGFELSLNNTTFANVITLGGTATVASTPIYIRLTAADAMGSYSGNIVLSSPGTTGINVSMPLSTVSAYTPPVLAYATPLNYPVKSPITPLFPTSSGVASQVYSTSAIAIGSPIPFATGIAVDASGNIYVANNTTYIQKILPGGTTTSTISPSGYPSAIAIDAAGNIFFADGISAIYKIPAAGGTAIKVSNATLAYPWGVAVDATGNVYASDSNNGVYKFPVGGGPMVTLLTGLNNPNGMVVDAAGNIYVADTNNGLIKKISADGSSVVNIGTGFKGPGDMALDAAGNVFVADSGTGSVKEILASDGSTITIATGMPGVFGITLDKARNIFVSDNAGVAEIKLVGGYYINPVLPAGMLFNNATGAISGTPSVVSTATNYTVKAYNASGSTTATVNISVFAAPTIQATNLLFTNTTATTTTASWTNGNGQSRAVFLFAGVAGNAAPVDLTAYAASAAFKTGDQIGNSGWFCVYNGTGSTVNITGLSGLTAYRMMALEYNGTGANVAYLTTATTGNPANITTAAPAIVATVVSGPVNTVYGTASGSAVFNVSGSYLSSAITIAAPSGFELSLNNTTFANVITLGGTATVASTPIYIRLTAADAMGSYSGNIVLSSPGTTGINVSMPLSTVSAYTPPVLAYATPLNYPVKSPITPLFPTSSGVASQVYSTSAIAIGSPIPFATGIAVDASGNIYVANNTTYIQKILPGGTTTSTISPSGYPSAIAIDAAGNIFFADGISAIYKIPAAGGTAIKVSNATLAYPWGVAVDATGNVYASDSNNGVYKFPVGGGPMVTLLTGLNNPNGMVVDAVGNIYVADTNNGLIKKISADGSSVVNIGTGFKGPGDMALDAAGNVFVADSGTGSVKEILASDGSTITIATGMPGVFGITLDKARNIFVSDNAGVAEIKLVGGYYIDPVLPAGMLFNNATGAISGTPSVVSTATNYTVKAYNASGSTTATVNISVFAAPTIQATNVLFSNTTATTTTASWTNGNGQSRAVFLFAGVAGNAAPVDLTAYAASAAFKTGDQIGSTGWYCVYNGTGSTVNITGLSGLTAYRMMALEYNGTGANVAYLTTATTGNPGNFTTLANTTTINSITTATGGPGNASSIQYAVTFGAAVSGLNVGNFLLSATGDVSGYNISSVTGSGSSYTVTVNTGTGDGTIVLKLVNATGINPGISTALPFSGNLYTIDKTAPKLVLSNPSVSKTGVGPVSYTATWTDANLNVNSIVLQPAQVLVSTTGTATGSVTVSGTGASRIITFNGVSGNGTIGISLMANTASDFAGNAALASSPSTTFAVANAPTVQATNVKFNNISSSGGNLSWTNGNGVSRAVFIAPKTSITPLPLDSTTYHYAATAAAGTQIGSSGWFCVYNGSGSATTIAGLKAATLYRFMVLEYNGSTGTEKYLTTTATGNPLKITTAYATPTVQAINVNFANTTSSGTTVKWTNGNGTSRVVFIAPKTSIPPLPLDSVSYLAGATASQGTTIGSSGWFCVYNGTGSTVSVIGLKAATAYRFMVLEYNGLTGTQRYLTSISTNNPLKMTTLGVNAIVNNNDNNLGFEDPKPNIDVKVEPANILSPNGDGKNDTWVVKNIELYPGNQVTVTDQGGNTVFTQRGYTNNWGGTYRGAVIAEGTYYYLIDLGNGSTLKGFITVVKDQD